MRPRTSSTGPSYYDLQNSDVYHVFARRNMVSGQVVGTGAIESHQ